MDPKPLRIFNPYTQAKKFDPICEYIKYWIPELSKVSNSDLLNGEISNLEKNNYSSPIVNHNIQQRLFKSLYAEIWISSMQFFKTLFKFSATKTCSS